MDFLPHQFSKMITMKVEMISALVMGGKQRLLSLRRTDSLIIMLPVPTNILQWLSQCSLPFQVAMKEFTRVTSIHPPGHNLLQMHFIVQEMPKCSLVPLDDCIHGWVGENRSVGNCLAGHIWPMAVGYADNKGISTISCSCWGVSKVVQSN